MAQRVGFGLYSFNVWLSCAVDAFLCSALNFAALASSLLFVTDPPIIFERSLAKIEKTVDFTSRGIALASKLSEGIWTDETLKKENPYAFCTGLVLFSSATCIITTPLPVFFSKDLAAPTNFVFMMIMLNSVGGVAGILAFLLIAVARMPLHNLMFASLILALMGFTHALFLVYTLSISMEIIPQGKAGLFNVLVNIGGTCGSFTGPFIAQTFGFIPAFLTAGALYLLAYVAFKAFR